MVKEHALLFGDFKLSSGQQSSYFIDMSKLTNHGEGLDIITLHLARWVDDADAVGGPVLGAAPLVGGTLLAHRRQHYNLARPLRGFLVRKEPKDGEMIEGYLKPGDKVLMVEDVVTTGGQLMRAIRHVEGTGAQVVKAVAVLDRLGGAQELLKDYNFESLLTIEDLGITT
jgi:orotate phosphoribosyltransferase